MGSDRFYPEERPLREVSVYGFWIDRHPVTVAEFRRFVKATGYLTGAAAASLLMALPAAGGLTRRRLLTRGQGAIGA